MKFPKRASSHISESDSWKIFQFRTPSEWIIREVTERDYGIDSYIEIVEENGDVTGNLCSIQLKSTQTINWKNDISVLSGIQKSTINYWIGLPVPVFIFWADIEQSKLYFCSVEDQVRSRFIDFQDESYETFSFEFFKYLEIGTELGNIMFKAFYNKQRNYPIFTNNLQDIIFHFDEYNMHILGNLGRDCFLYVDDREFFLTLHIYLLCLNLSQYFGIKLTISSLKSLFEYDKKCWPNDIVYNTIHELTHDKLLLELYPIFCNVIKRSIDFITKHQKEYWERNEYLIFRMCDQVDLKSLESAI